MVFAINYVDKFQRCGILQKERRLARAKRQVTPTVVSPILYIEDLIEDLRELKR